MLKNLCNKKIIAQNEHHDKCYSREWKHKRQAFIHEPSFNEGSQSSNRKPQSRSTEDTHLAFIKNLKNLVMPINLHFGKGGSVALF